MNWRPNLIHLGRVPLSGTRLSYKCARRAQPFIFILIGIAIGIILAFQIRANPVKIGASSLEQLEVKKTLLQSFSVEQEALKTQLAAIKEKKEEAQKIIERRFSKQTLQLLDKLKSLTDLTAVEGEGIRITLNDNPAVSRLDFSSVNENFVQASDLRDLVNALALKDAKAIAINGKRVTPFTSIQSAFDTMLVGNFQIAPPFVIEAVGNSEALTQAISVIQKRKILTFVDIAKSLSLNSVENIKPLKLTSIASQ